MKKGHILEIMRLKNTIFTFKDVSLLWGEPDANFVKKKLYRYVKSGKLYAIRRGIYAKDKNYDKFELATKIYTPSYISMESVLSKEGVIFQHYNNIFVASYLTREIVCEDQTYKFRKIKDSALSNHLSIEKRENYSIATKERAFLDMLYLHKDYHFDNLASIDWDKCFEVLPLYRNKAMAKRLDSYFRLSKYA